MVRGTNILIVSLSVQQSSPQLILNNFSQNSDAFEEIPKKKVSPSFSYLGTPTTISPSQQLLLLFSSFSPDQRDFPLLLSQATFQIEVTYVPARDVSTNRR